MTLRADVRQTENAIEFSQFEDFNNDELYFIAPQKFLGNKLASYGGNLTFVINYEGSANSKPERLEIRISVSFSQFNHKYNRLSFIDYIKIKFF